jgi:LCP family protein required for cell wall assembly
MNYLNGGNMRREYIVREKKKVIVLTLLLIFAALSAAVFFIIHSYINKMNIRPASFDIGREQELVMAQQKDDTTKIDTAPEEIEAASEEEVTGLPDSSQTQIETVEKEIRENMEKDSTSIAYDKDVFNILLIGSDSRKSGGSGRSDTMLLVSINKKSKVIVVTSLLRDIFLQIPGKSNNRLNAAYAFGGADLLLSTVEQNFRVKVEQYASIDFYAFIDIVDVVGGLTLEVSEEDIPVINGYIAELNQLTGQEKEKDYLTDPGTLLLNGKQTLGYVRNRYVGNSDFDRTARQREVLSQIYDKVKRLNLIEMKELLDAILPQITTNLSEGELFSLILSLPIYTTYDTQQWSIPEPNSYQSMRIRGMAVLGIDFDENIDALHKKVYQDNSPS